MNSREIEQNVKRIIENFSKESFLYDLLLVFRPQNGCTIIHADQGFLKILADEWDNRRSSIPKAFMPQVCHGTGCRGVVPKPSFYRYFALS